MPFFNNNLRPETRLAYIPPNCLFALATISQTQMQCACNANGSTYILYDFKSKWGTIWVLFYGKNN